MRYFQVLADNFVSIALQHAYASCMPSAILLWQLRPSVSPSHSGIVSKRMHVSSNSVHHLAGRHDGSFIALPPLQASKANSLSEGVKYTGMGKICDCRPKLPFISETVPDRFTVTVEH